jgi:outer membrane protein assembly factor BamB
VYIGSDGGYDFLDPCGGGTPYLYALDSVTGEERWRFETGCRQVLPSPAVVGGVVYMGGGSDPCNPESPYVYALDPATGEERWRFETLSDVSCSPAVVDGVVYICTGSLYAITEE